MKRIFGLLLSIVLLTGLMPAAVRAAYINDVSITVDVPAGGQTPWDAEPQTATSDPRIYAYEWSDDGERMTSFDAFEKGKTYELRMTLAGTVEFYQEARVKVNGEPVSWTYFNGGSGIDRKMITVSKEFTITDELLNDLNVILPPAQAGTKISKVANDGYVEGTEGAIVSAIFWYLDGVEQNVQEPFQVGKTYDARVRLYACDGYRYADPLRLSVNGETVPGVTVSGEYATFTIQITSSSTPLTASAIIVEVTEPKVGEKPSSYAGHSGGGGYYTNKTSTLSWDYFRDGVSWYDETAESQLSYNDTFRGSHSYSVKIAYKLLTGYQWPDNSVHRINGKTPTSVIVNGEDLSLKYVFPALPKALESISVTKAPSRTQYTEGELFDPLGMVITAVYTDESTAEVTGYTCKPDGPLSEEDTAITISYTENGITKTALCSIQVAKLWEFDKNTGIVTLSSAVNAASPVIAASYDAENRFLGFVLLTKSGAVVQPGTDHITLLWVDSATFAPKRPSETFSLK